MHNCAVAIQPVGTSGVADSLTADRLVAVAVGLPVGNLTGPTMDWLLAKLELAHVAVRRMDSEPVAAVAVGAPVAARTPGQTDSSSPNSPEGRLDCVKTGGRDFLDW